MTIKVSKEPSGLGQIEKCFLCSEPTRYWNLITNYPVCTDCAKTRKTWELTLTIQNINTAIKKATGLDSDLHKFFGIYYWGGKAASLFDEQCIHMTSLNYPTTKWNLDRWVEDFTYRIEQTEKEHGKTIQELITDSEKPHKPNVVIDISGRIF